MNRWNGFIGAMILCVALIVAGMTQLADRGPKPIILLMLAVLALIVSIWQYNKARLS
jgi:CDP-diglyceride synthetase